MRRESGLLDIKLDLLQISVITDRKTEPDRTVQIGTGPKTEKTEPPI